MRGTRAIFAAVVLTAIVGLASVANATTYHVQFAGVGSSAMFNTLSAAAFTDLCSSVSGSDCRHWSQSGTNSGDSQNWAQAVDSRNSSIPPEAGTFFVAWDNVSGNVWSYLSVDTIVGNRLFFANPRATQQIDSGAISAAGANKVPAAILYNRQTSADQADETTGIPSGVLSAVQTTFTAAISDVRPEDAKFEVLRVLAPYAASGTGLGYGTSGNATCFQGSDSWTVSINLGCPIYGTWGSKATPSEYALTGHDPFTGNAAWKYKTIEVGAEPVVFVYNVTDANGLGATGPDGINVAFKNLNRFTATYLFNGSLGLAQDIDPSLTTALKALSANPPVFPILREPLSGTMTATEFNVFRSIEMLKEIPNAASQETGVLLSSTCTVGVNCADPLYLPGPNGSIRYRAIGTGAEISGVSGVGGVKNIEDGIGYAFFSFGNVNPLAGTAGSSGTAGGKGRYVTLDGVDPINQGYGPYSFNGGNYLAGQVPNCVAPCQEKGGASLPNVRNGSYPAWTIIRAITDATGVNLTNTQALVTAAQNEVNNTTADFVPFVCTNATTCNIGGSTEPGLTVFHSHFTPAGVAGAPHNGNVVAESGGDVGGAVFTDQADIDYHTDTTKELVSIRQ
ncbi:MAG TPA: hypothetical protein VJX69_09220 [Terriglobales bacterium]|nr:hypothetical protein [Terriglobales bacterium]